MDTIDESLKISIIIPVYNVENYVGKCISSVIAQTYRNIECIIIDNCSTDKTLYVIQNKIDNYNGPIIFNIIKHKNNEGLSVSRNDGIAQASGDYLFFLDGDDDIYPSAIQTLVSLAMKYSGVDVVQSNCYNELYPKIHYKEDSFHEFYNGKSVYPVMIMGLPHMAWNKLIRRKLVLDNHVFFERGITHEDNLYQFFLSKYVKSVAVCKESTYHNLTHENTLINNPDKTASCASLLRIIEVECENLSENKYKRYERFAVLNVVLLFSLKYKFEYISDKALIDKHLKNTLIAIGNIKGNKRFLCVVIWYLRQPYNKFYHMIIRLYGKALSLSIL